MNRRFLYLITGCLLAAVNSFAQDSQIYDKERQLHYVLSVIDTIPSKYLGETRTINIYLPEGYAANGKERYPVLYLPDGGVQEDFVHITGLVQYNTQPWINRFPPTIVVGIENINRRKDFTFAVNSLDFLARMGLKKEQMPVYGGSGNYIAFLEKELQPCIDKKYRTNAHRTIIGESLGGLLATEILLKHRQLFDTYIIISPSLWWGRESLLAEAPRLLQQGDNKQVKVYVGACAKEEDKIMYDDAVQLAEVLKKDGIQTFYDYLPDEVHATIIHQAVYNAFKLLYPPAKQ